MRSLFVGALVLTTVGQAHAEEPARSVSENAEVQDAEVHMLSFEIRKGGNIVGAPALVGRPGEVHSVTLRSESPESLSYKLDVAIHSRGDFLSPDGERKAQLFLDVVYHERIGNQWKAVSEVAFDRVVVGGRQGDNNDDGEPIGAGMSLISPETSGAKVDHEDFAINFVSATLASDQALRRQFDGHAMQQCFDDNCTVVADGSAERARTCCRVCPLNPIRSICSTNSCCFDFTLCGTGCCP